MDFVEASNIDLQKEGEHWWIKTRFQYIDLALQKFSRNDLSVLEIGCGTAQNLAYLRKDSPFRERFDQLVGVDLNLPEGFTRNDLSEKDILTNNPEGIPKDKKFDLLIMLDLIEHLDDPVSLLKEYKSYLKPDGRLLILVPSFQSLWSQHDVALGHKKRYTCTIMDNETKGAGFKRVTTGYLFSPFFPVVYILRRFFRDNSGDSGESDLKLPHPMVNAICSFLGIIERKIGNPLPFGTSAYGIYELDQ